MLSMMKRQKILSMSKLTGVVFSTSKDRHNQNTKKYPTEEKNIASGDKLRKPGGRKLTHVGRSDRVFVFSPSLFLSRRSTASMSLYRSDACKRVHLAMIGENSLSVHSACENVPVTRVFRSMPTA